MRLDAIKKSESTGEWYFKYYCPEKMKIRGFKSVNKTKALGKRKQLQKAQQYAPESPEAGITPFGVVLEQYEKDRKNDVRGGRLRPASFDGYIQHIRRLQPLGAEEIEFANGVYRFRFYKKDIGRFIWANAPTKEEAEALREEINLSASTDDPLYYDKLNALEAPIQNLKWEFIQKVLDNIDRSQSTRKHHFVTYTNVISWAIKKGYLYKTQKDMIANAKPGRGVKKKIEIPDEASVKKLIECSDEFWKPFWMIAASTGARLGELTALSWRNIHLNQGMIYIEEATTRTGEISSPKTANAFRELPIGTQIINALSKLPRDGDLVFPCPEFSLPFQQYNKFGPTALIPGRRLRAKNENRPMKTEEVYRMGMKPVLDAHNIEWKGRIHCLRHLAASRMIDLNWNIKTIQTRLGHANAVTTLDIYGHLMQRKDFQQEAKELGEGLF